MKTIYSKKLLTINLKNKNKKSIVYRRKKENQIYISLIKDTYALALN